MNTSTTVRPDPTTNATIHKFGAVLANQNGIERERTIAQAQQFAFEQVPKERLTASRLLDQAVDISDLLREGVAPPSFLPSPSFRERLFYAEHLSLFAGHKKAGKSWAMTLLARDVMGAGQPVVYVDNENGRELFTER